MRFLEFITFGLLGKKTVKQRQLRQEHFGRYWVHVVDETNAADCGLIYDVLVDGRWVLVEDVDKDVAAYIVAIADGAPNSFSASDLLPAVGSDDVDLAPLADVMESLAIEAVADVIPVVETPVIDPIPVEESHDGCECD